MSGEIISIDLQPPASAQAGVQVETLPSEEKTLFTSGAFGSEAVSEESMTRKLAFGMPVLETVIEQDNRLLIQDTTQFPFRAICSLDLYFSENGALSRGTGTFIAPNMILTCAHNLFKTQLQKRVVSVGVNPGRAGELVPFKQTHATKLHYPKDYEQYGDPDFDYAVLEVADPVGSTIGYCGIRASSDDELKQSNIFVIGYPADRDPTARTMYRDQSLRHEVTPNQIYHRADTYGGNSGGPAFIFPNNNINEIPHIVGVHINGDGPNTPGWTNGARRINRPVFDQIVKWAQLQVES